MDAPAEAAAPGERALLLSVGADLFAIPLATVRVVLEEPPLTRVPEAVSSLVGVVNVRGQVVPVFDTPGVLGTGAPVTPRHVAVVETAHGLLGLTATEVGSGELTDDLGPSDLPLGAGRRRAGASVATVVDTAALADAMRVEAT